MRDLHLTWINTAAPLGVISFKVSLTLKKHVVCWRTLLSTKNGHKARPDCCRVCTGQPQSRFILIRSRKDGEQIEGFQQQHLEEIEV